MKKEYKILFIGMIILFLVGCVSPGESLSTERNAEQTQRVTPTPEPIIELQITEIRNEKLKGTVIPTSAEAVEENGYNIFIIGADFFKSTGDVIKDTFDVGTGLLNEPTDYAVARGFAMGFKNGNANIAKKDAYLSLYLLFEYDKEDISQRESVIPKLKISGKDNEGESVDFIYFSYEDKYIDIDYPYAVVILKAYYDSEFIEFKINNKTYKIIIEDL